MRFLVVGGGGREHALCWSLAASPLADAVLCAPGNAGIARDAECVPVAVDDIDGLVALARAREIDLVVVGPELPLVLGLVDRLEALGIRAFGPSAAAARLEGSKAFMKAFCARHGIPTAAHAVFTGDQAEAALAHVEAAPLPIVVKADGLAAGKGVVIAETRAAARDAVEAAFAGAFGAAGATLVIEEFMAGEEASLFAICDGRTALEIGTAQDHKRAHDGDQGPNTGGMGAYSPAPVLTPELIEEVLATIVRPTLDGLAAEGILYRGFLYAGLMLTAAGPKLVEYNVRYGDPECQAVLPRLMTDLGQLVVGACDGILEHMDLRWYPDHALTVVLAARGYPGPYARGSVIGGLEALEESDDVLLFHAATRREGERWLADGGRVLGITGLGATLQEARDRAYAGVARLDWPEGFCRGDIGWRALPG
ncbi:MAG: phosphoribosylamine--glycine ligase [Geminicoccaceae bacterium]|nr:phosphoribosylamine--glycine ligase [Geminicoccaceae bacterium]